MHRQVCRLWLHLHSFLCWLGYFIVVNLFTLLILGWFEAYLVTRVKVKIAYIPHNCIYLQIIYFVADEFKVFAMVPMLGVC